MVAKAMQADYDKHVLNAVASLEKDMKEYLTFFDEESATWLSIGNITALVEDSTTMVYACRGDKILSLFL